jgi:hypothetical protein
MVADALAGNISAEATKPLSNIFADAMRGTPLSMLQPLLPFS